MEQKVFYILYCEPNSFFFKNFENLVFALQEKKCETNLRVFGYFDAKLKKKFN